MSTTTPLPTGLLRPLHAEQVRWGRGFWQEVQQRTFEVTVPQMWRSLSNPEVSPGLQNFKIAAGRESGEHVGPPFMDGDFYKWLEAAIAELEVEPQEWLADTVEEVAQLIASVQREDGYLHTPTLISARANGGVVELSDRFAFETYNLGHLITAGVRHYEVTGSTTLLNAARKAAGYLEDLATNKPVELARSAICPSHYMAVIELYRVTADERYLRLAEAFVRVRDDFDGGDDNQDRLPVREQSVVAGHAVRANYLYAGLADLVAENGDDGLRTVLEGLWDDVADTKLYITGGCGALYDGASPDGDPWQWEISKVHQSYGRAYQLPNTTAHSESCANIGMILWSERMLALTGDAKYADAIETIAYNSLLAGIGLGGNDYFYTNPLRQVRDLPYPLRRPGDTALDPVPAPPPSDERLRQSYLSCFCCPPNTARTLARFHERAASVTDDELYVHLYGGSDIRVSHGDRTLALREDTQYPWGEDVRFTVEEATDGGIPVRLRIPGWSRGASLLVNGEPAEVSAPGSYVKIDREWRAGDTIVLSIPMPSRVIRANRLAEEVTNQVAVQRGPVVFCLESTDLPAGMPLERIALRRGTELQAEDGEVAGHRMQVIPVSLSVLPRGGTDSLYEDLSDDELEVVETRLIPYYAWGNRGQSEMSVWLPVVW
ncbi:glycoside hydrolase family 127 protein [Humibacter sp. RRB41]|uniref:glycoside hydrolase family 127 protein n=1 Tax=Humibacter sp. RRB41 TaxID=2919946 RepID=UPI001FAB0C18|nr:beta-L-arabinofuranosidase domain-containing protein [Humibacter sp. RRB41]